jgi:hypothetical protein
VEAAQETAAIRARRDVSQVKISRAKREKLKPKDPSSAIMAYTNAMGTFTNRTEALLLKHVVGALPVVGSGDPLDIVALQQGLEDFRNAAVQMAHSVRRSAGAAFDRATEHSRKQAERILNLRIPKADAALAKDAFVERQVRLLQRAAEDQAAAVAKAIRQYKEGTSMRQAMVHQLWVTRERGKQIARNEITNLAKEELRRWSVTTGSAGGIYVTRRDELVRPTHAAHDGRFYAWTELPSTLGEINCRCVMIPVESAL